MALSLTLRASAENRTPSAWETLEAYAEERGSGLSHTATFRELREALGERPEGLRADNEGGQRGVRFRARSGEDWLEFRFVPEIPGVQGEQFYLIERRGGALSPSILRRAEDGDGFMIWRNARDPRPRRVRLGNGEGSLTASIEEEGTQSVSATAGGDPFPDSPPPPSGLPFPEHAPAAVTLPGVGRLTRAEGSIYDEQTGQTRPYASYRDGSGTERAFRVRYGDDFAIQTPGGALYSLDGGSLGPAGAFAPRSVDGVPRYLASRGWSGGRSLYVDVAGREYEGRAQLQFVQTGWARRRRACGYWQQVETISPVAATAAAYDPDPAPPPPRRTSDSSAVTNPPPASSPPSSYESRPLWIGPRTYSGRAAFGVNDNGATVAYFGTRADGSDDWRPLEGARTYYYAAGGLYDREGRRLGDFAVSPDTPETGTVFLGTAGTLRWPDGRAYHFDGWNHLDGFGRTFIVRGPPPGYQTSFSSPQMETAYARGVDGVYRGRRLSGWTPGLERAPEGEPRPTYVVRGDRVFRHLGGGEDAPAEEFEGRSFVDGVMTSQDGSLRIRRASEGFSVQRRAFVRMNWVRFGPQGTMLEGSYRAAWMADPSTRVAVPAASAPMVAAPVPPAVGPSLDEILAGFLGESPGAHSLAADAISRHADRPAAVARLIAFLRSTPQAPGARHAAAVLGEIAPPGHGPLLALSMDFLDGLESPETAVRERSQGFLSALGPSGTSAVRLALRNDGRADSAERRRRLAAAYVGRARVRDLPTLVPLTALLHDRSHASAAARAEAARALGLLGPEAAPAALPALLASAIHSGEDDGVHQAAEQAIRAVAPTLSAERRRALEEHARGIYIGLSHYSERYEPALMLVAAGYMDERILSILEHTLLGTGGGGVGLPQRRAAAEALARVVRTHSAEASRNQLEALLVAAFAPGQDSQIREVCRGALAAVAPALLAAAESPGGLDAAKDMLRDGGPFSNRPYRWS